VLALPQLGPEPLEQEFTTTTLAQSFQKRKQPVKAALLDQAVVAGIGNIYADEALFLAGIHPGTEARHLQHEELEQLRLAIIAVLEQGIQAGGTSFSDYLDMWGERGSNVQYLRVYQRDGQACLNCGTPIEKISIGGRSTHFCPSCQKKKSSEQATYKEALTNTL
jgi:formamidopyrimidine-DNA glycosylase